MKITVEAPDSLNEITLEQFQEFQQIENPTDKDIVRVFLNLSENIVSKIPKAQIMNIAGQIGKMISESKPRFINKFELGGRKFGFIPKLDEITSGEFDDATMYMPSSKEEGDKIVQDYSEAHKCMAVLFRPVTMTKKGQYLIEDYQGSDKYAEELKQMPLSVVLGAMVFFYDLMSELLKAIPNYMEREVSRIGSLKSGEDTTDTIHLLKETLEELKKSLSYPSILAS